MRYRQLAHTTRCYDSLLANHMAKVNIIETSTFYIVQMQIIYLLNLWYNLSLMHGPSATAEPLVL